MREIKFRLRLRGRMWNVQTLEYSHKNQGYVLRKVTEHPFATSRGFVREQRLVMEERLERFLKPNEFVHHIDGNRENNDYINLKLCDGQSTHAKGHSRGERNPNGRFVASEPIFENIKFRLLNTNTGNTEIYTLSELIGKTYRGGQFKFRGRFTGLKDKSGREIYEGDLLDVDCGGRMVQVVWFKPQACFDTRVVRVLEKQEFDALQNSHWDYRCKVIGNIHVNPELLK